jgi:hypothetical protein
MPTKLQGRQSEDDLERKEPQKTAGGPRCSISGRVLSLKPVGKWLAHEVRQVCKVTWDPPSGSRDSSRRDGGRVSRQAFSDAQLALGRRMYAAGIDDGECGERIQGLDNGPGGAGDPAPSGKTPEGRRKPLLIRLAAAALAEDGPLPGADVEYRAARKAHAALREQDEELANAKALLTPRDKAGYCRVAIGYGTIGLLLLSSCRCHIGPALSELEVRSPPPHPCQGQPAERFAMKTEVLPCWC